MMKKETFIRFIDKYSLGGNIETVKWKVISDKKILMTRGELNSKSFTMEVILKNFTEISDDIQIPIGNTQKVKMMLSPFDEDIALKLNKNGDRLLGFFISDENCESYCSAADPSVIPPVAKDLGETKAYDVEIPLSVDFVTRFLKAKAALQDIEEFTVRMNKQSQVEFVLGYPIANSNRISIAAPTVDKKSSFDGSFRFPSINIVEVLRSNKEIENAKLFISSFGVIKLQYSNEQFDSTYWQFAFMPKK
jgi:hypothetical protein